MAHRSCIVPLFKFSHSNFFYVFFDSCEQRGSGYRNAWWKCEEESGRHGQRFVGHLLLPPLPSICEFLSFTYLWVKQPSSSSSSFFTWFDRFLEGHFYGCLHSVLCLCLFVFVCKCVCSRAVWGQECRCCLCLIKASSCWRWWGAALLHRTTSECWGLTGEPHRLYKNIVCVCDVRQSSLLLSKCIFALIKVLIQKNKTKQEKSIKWHFFNILPQPPFSFSSPFISLIWHPGFCISLFMQLLGYPVCVNSF